MKVYLLLHIIPYHGGTRGMELGIYDSVKECEKAWTRYKRYTLRKEGQAELGDDNYGKIESFEMNGKPREWAGQTVQSDMT